MGSKGDKGPNSFTVNMEGFRAHPGLNLRKQRILPAEGGREHCNWENFTSGSSESWQSYYIRNTGTCSATSPSLLGSQTVGKLFNPFELQFP